MENEVDPKQLGHEQWFHMVVPTSGGCCSMDHNLVWLQRLTKHCIDDVHKRSKGQVT